MWYVTINPTTKNKKQLRHQRQGKSTQLNMCLSFLVLISFFGLIWWAVDAMTHDDTIERKPVYSFYVCHKWCVSETKVNGLTRQFKLNMSKHSAMEVMVK